MSHRLRGLLIAVVGGLVSFVMLKFMIATDQKSSTDGATGFIVFAVPLVFTFIGTLEFFSNRSFLDFSDAWDNLAGWQRGILGTMIVILSFMMMILLVVLFA